MAGMVEIKDVPGADPGAVDELRSLLDGGRLITDPAVMSGWTQDEAHLAEPGEPCAVLLASSTAEVSRALEWASRHRVPVVPRGAGSGLAGGACAIEGCLVVGVERMTAVRELVVEDQYAVVEAGVINADLDAAAAEVGLMYAPDPSSHRISTIGGNVATNAGGLRCVKYGVTRDSVLGLEVVLADGRVITTGRRTVKGVTGYDLTSLLVGSEGTLGVITAATVRLRPRPRGITTVAATFPDLQSAAEAVALTVQRHLEPSLLELIDQATLTAIESWKSMGLDRETHAMLVAQADGSRCEEAAAELSRAFEDAGASFVAVSSDEQEAAQLLEVRRLAYPAAERLGRCLVEDVGVPRSRLPEMLRRIEQAAQRHDVRIMTVAHAGDGNVHPTFVFDPADDGEVPASVWAAADEVFTAALSLGGTLTGEHGVGLLKKRWLGLELGPEVMDVQRAIKSALDPGGILNPGKAI